MRLFQPQVRPGFEWAVPVHDTDHERIWGLDGTSRRSTWQPVQVDLLTTDDDGRPRSRADLPWLGEHVLVLRPAAASALAPLLEPWGELLPLDCPDAELHLFHALTVLDALDEDRSDIVRFDDGSILAVDAYAFRADAVTAPVFKVPQLLRGPLFVDERFAAAAAGLAGTDFIEVWADHS